jgi:hypothetical protein
MVHSLFFLDHDHPEQGHNERSSKSNQWEARFSVLLARYLLQQGYLPSECMGGLLTQMLVGADTQEIKPSLFQPILMPTFGLCPRPISCACAGDVVIIVPYVGQLFAAKQALAAHKFSVLISDKDKEQLAQADLEGGSWATARCDCTNRRYAVVYNSCSNTERKLGIVFMIKALDIRASAWMPPAEVDEDEEEPGAESAVAATGAAASGSRKDAKNDTTPNPPANVSLVSDAGSQIRVATIDNFQVQELVTLLYTMPVWPADAGTGDITNTANTIT